MNEMSPSALLSLSLTRRILRVIIVCVAELGCLHLSLSERRDQGIQYPLTKSRHHFGGNEGAHV